MFMGGCAGSTGGGMKCMRFMVMFKHIQRELRLLIHPRAIISLKIDRKAVQTPIVNGIFAFMALYLGVWSASTLCLVIIEMDPVTALSASTATLSNIGPGLNKIGAVNNYAWISDSGKWILMFNMLAGRLELFPVFALLAPSFWKK
jgi:trk system potassium uptake protein TrkH